VQLLTSVVPAVNPAGWARQSVPLTVYAVQLLLNFMWTPLFFKLHKLDWASADILGEQQPWQANRCCTVQVAAVHSDCCVL
jgi:tryptophan-rich sensory protein